MSDNLGGMKAIAHIVQLFGSQSALAKAAGVTQPSVAEWVSAGRIPTKRIRAILLAARERGLDITAEDLIGVERSAPGEAA